MMRSRSLRPGFFKNEILAGLPFEARLLYEGLWCLADREGRLEDRPRRIKADLLPYDNVDVDGLLDLLATAEEPFILRYAGGGLKCIQILKFLKHQTPHYKELASEFPAPPGWQDTAAPLVLPVDQACRIMVAGGGVCRQCGSTARLTIVRIDADGDAEDTNLQVVCRLHIASQKDDQPSMDQSSADHQPMINDDHPIILNPVKELVKVKDPVNRGPGGPGGADGAPDKPPKTTLRVVPRKEPAKPNRSAEVIMAFRAVDLEPSLAPRDHAAIKACPKPVGLIVDAYQAARQALWPPGDPYLRNNLSVHAVIDRLDGYEAWVASGRPPTPTRPAAAPRHNRYVDDDLSIYDDPPKLEHG